MSLPLPVMGCELVGFGSVVTGWVFVKLSGWLAVVCRVVAVVVVGFWSKQWWWVVGSGDCLF